jgi:aryl-alcohol dehydrogenase-like predicted oxidoreductase
MRNRMSPRHFDVVEAVAAIAEKLDRPMSQVAINWVRQRPGVSTVLLGARSMDQLRENLESASWHLDPATIDELDRLNPLPPEYPLDFLTYTGVA